MLRWLVGALVLTAATLAPAYAQQPAPLRPDLSGVWAARFVTTLERPPFAPGLATSPADAPAFIARVIQSRPEIIDPDVAFTDVQTLAEVNGELRTSIIVDPPTGQLPYSEAGRARLARPLGHDNPEDRPLGERCVSGFIAPPFRPIPRLTPLQIVQTSDHVVLNFEDAAGVRIIAVGAPSPPPILASFEGVSSARWEGDTLVIETTGFRPDQSFREVVGRNPVHLSSTAHVTERLTRLSGTALLYAYTVDDPVFYTQPWSGEFNLSRFDGPVLEYACHEGNYSMRNILLGGRAEAVRKTARTGK